VGEGIEHLDEGAEAPRTRGRRGQIHDHACVLEQLKDEERGIRFVCAGVRQANDMGVVEAGQGPALACEACVRVDAGRGAREGSRPWALEGEEAVGASVADAVDDPHAAGAQRGEDVVAAGDGARGGRGGERERAHGGQSRPANEACRLQAVSMAQSFTIEMSPVPTRS